MSENLATVCAFIDGFNRNDLEAIMEHFSQDAVYHNIPLEPVKGVDVIRATIAGFLGMAKEIDWVVHHIAEAEGGAVLTERTDRFLINDEWVELPVSGTFELRDGKITAWRDYFDMKQFQDMIAG